MSDSETAAYVSLALVPGVGPARLAALLARFGSASAVLEAPQRELQELKEVTVACATAIKSTSPDAGHQVIELSEKRGYALLLPHDVRFPPMLLQIHDSPALLFAVGRLDLLPTTSVAIVGSRDHSRYGAEVCRHLATGAAQGGITVVSGMARGLDAVAHAAALDAPGGSVGVLGNGLGVVYPSANARLYERMALEGCLVTEFPPGERPTAGSFSRRNRLISGLARATVVVEAGEKSGALTTAKCAASQGRDVMAVPGPITSPVSRGCNQLIRDGAKPVLGLHDLFESVGFTFNNNLPAISLPGGLTHPEKEMMDRLALGDQHVDELAVGLNTGSSEALAVLTSLEIRGLVAQAPGKIFRRIEPDIG